MNFIKNKIHDERGVALISVLVMLLTASLLVALVISSSKIAAFSTTGQLARQRSRYLMEGAGNRVQWLLATEYTSSESVDFRSFNYSDYDYERYLPDGREHVIDYHGTMIKFSLRDYFDLPDFSPSQYRSTLTYLQRAAGDDSEYIDKLEVLRDLLLDYNDSDDTINEDGREEADYEADGMAPLPRNNNMEFREELFFIKEFLLLYPADKYGNLSSVQPMTAASLKPRNQNPSIFCPDKKYLQGVFQLSDENMVKLSDALSVMQENSQNFNDSADGTLQKMIGNSNRLRWNPSNYYVVNLELAETQAGTRLVWAFVNSDVSGPEDGVVQYLDWQLF